MNTFKIPTENVRLLVGKLEKLNKKCLKYNLPEIKFEISESYTERVRKGVFVDFSDVTVTGEAPKLEGWEFRASLDHDYENPIIVFSPGKTIPDRYKGAGCNCEHCNTKRYRRKTYIVRNVETNEYKQVGKTCLRDFLGHENPESVAKYYEAIRETLELFENTEYTSYSGVMKYNVDYLLSVASLICREEQRFVPQSFESDENPSTSTLVKEYLFGNVKRFFGDVLQEDIDLASKAVEYIKGMEYESTYTLTVKQLLDAGQVKFEHFNFVVSVIGVYKKHIEQERSRVEIKEEWLGTEKERLTGTLKILAIKFFDSKYGGGFTVRMLDKDNRLLVWFASKLPDFKEGDTINAKFTIKKHDEYNGKKQTLVTRVKEV